MMGADYTSLPPDLPVPEDDGAADHLPGAAIPSLPLAATADPDGVPPARREELRSRGTLDIAALAEETLVAYVYPRTGAPGLPLPDGWDDIPGARGCTPQSCAYRDALAAFAALGVKVIGLSAQPSVEQAAFAQREQIGFPLLSDPRLRLARSLGLPTFEAGGARLYRRLTFVAEAGRIVKVFYPVFPPDRDAAHVLGWQPDRPPAA